MIVDRGDYMDISQSTNIREIVKELIWLNPGVIIEIDNMDINRIVSSIPADKLVLPDGFYYNEKNGITNKHRTKSGSYISIRVKEKLIEKSDLFKQALKKYDFSIISDKLSKFALDEVYDRLCQIIGGHCKFTPGDVSGNLWWESRHLLYISNLKDVSRDEVSSFAFELNKLYASDKVAKIIEEVSFALYSKVDINDEKDNSKAEVSSVNSEEQSQETYADRLNQEFLSLLDELKKTSYDRMDNLYLRKMR